LQPMPAVTMKSTTGMQVIFTCQGYT